MIIDFHTHFYPDFLAPRAIEQGAAPPGVEAYTDGTRRGLEASMTEAGIDISVSLPLASTAENVASINRFAIENNRDNIVMLGTIHPDTPDKQTVIAELHKAGIKGIKIHPEFQLFNLSDPRMVELWHACIKYDMFILTHAGADISFKPPYRTSPESVAAFHRQYPELKLIAAHFGSWDMWDEVEKHLIGLPIFFDLGYTAGLLSRERMTSMIRKHGAERILFGTDSPWRSQKSDLEFVKTLQLEPLEKELILGKNASALIRL